MIKRSIAALALAVTMIPFVGSVAVASDAADTNIKERIECLFRVYIQEGGESGADCLT